MFFCSDQIGSGVTVKCKGLDFSSSYMSRDGLQYAKYVTRNLKKLSPSVYGFPSVNLYVSYSMFAINRTSDYHHHNFENVTGI